MGRVLQLFWSGRTRFFYLGTWWRECYHWATSKCSFKVEEI